MDKIQRNRAPGLLKYEERENIEERYVQERKKKHCERFSFPPEVRKKEKKYKDDTQTKNRDYNSFFLFFRGRAVRGRGNGTTFSGKKKIHEEM